MFSCEFFEISKNVRDVFYDLVPFVQFKKREKRPWESVTFRKAAGLQKKEPIRPNFD